MSRVSNFRHWVENIWRENCEERREWHDDPESLNVYFARYKWWLKREFRFQNKDKF